MIGFKVSIIIAFASNKFPFPLFKPKKSAVSMKKSCFCFESIFSPQMLSALLSHDSKKCSISKQQCCGGD
jgi:hypothetical protein